MEERQKKFIQTSKYLIDIIRRVLSKEKVIPLNNEEMFSYRDIYSLAKFHQVENIVFYGIENYLKEDDKLYQYWKKKNLQNITMSLTQEEEKKFLVDIFEKNQIDFLPVKGFYIRKLYPRDDFRFMSDLDILIDEKKAKKVKKLMKKNNYQIDNYNYYNHDEYTKKPFIHVELHRSLVTRDHPNYIYYKNIMHKTPLKEKYRYFHQLKKEDLYIYDIVHLKKHYDEGGVGIRNFIDIYLFLNENNFDVNYVNKEVEKIGLLDFKNQVEQISLKWFKEGDLQSLSEMEIFILKSGIFGTVEHAVAQEINNNQSKSKVRIILKRAFPNINRMKALYPSLEKRMILLPFYYIHRLFRGIKKRKKTIAEIKKINEKKK